MKLSVIIVVVLVVCLASNADAGWFRRTVRNIGRFISRNVRKIKQIGCPLLCPRVCQGTVCKLACRLGCGHRGKREAVKATEGHVSPLANMFDSYDFDDDGFITKDELATSINENKTDSHFVLAFAYADTNDVYLNEPLDEECIFFTSDDGRLDKEEFYKGPFVFEMDVDDNDMTYCRYKLAIDEDLEDMDGFDDDLGISEFNNGTIPSSNDNSATPNRPESNPQEKQKIL